MQPVYADFQRAHCLQNGALEVTVHRHDLACRLHLGAKRMIGKNKFIKRPARELHDAVIQGRLKAGLCLLRNRIGDFIQGIADRDFCRYLRNGIARGLGGQRRGSADTRIYLNDIVLVAVRVQSILRIAAALDAELTNNAQARTAEHLILMICERLGRCHDDAVTGMHTNRIEILHIADGDTVVIAIAHDLVLDFLPAGHTALDEHLADHAVLEALDDNFNELFLVIGNAAAGSAHRIGRTHDDRIADLIGKGNRRCNIFNNGAFRNRLIQLLHGFLEKLTILCLFYSRKRGSQKFYLIFFKNSLLGKLYRQIQSCLAAQCCQQSVRTLLGNDIFQKLHRKRLDINTIRDMRIRHDRCRIAVDENDLQALLLQCAASLRARIIKFCSLPDDDRARPYNHNLFQILFFRHVYSSPVSIVQN